MKKLLYHFLMMMVWFAGNAAVCQSQKDVVFESNADTARINALIRLGKLHCSNENQKALGYLQEALFLSNNLG